MARREAVQLFVRAPVCACDVGRRLTGGVTAVAASGVWHGFSRRRASEARGGFADFLSLRGPPNCEQ